jgi:hypothetical protein
MNNCYWSVDSWGNGYLPVNADEIIETANGLIDQYIAENPDDPEYEIQAYGEQLWEGFCQNGLIGNVEAVYEEEE